MEQNTQCNWPFAAKAPTWTNELSQCCNGYQDIKGVSCIEKENLAKDSVEEGRKIYEEYDAKIWYQPRIKRI